jgi:hypothetical protein
VIGEGHATVAWCKKHEVSIHRPFPKTLCAKFT